jgi:hypothetical protein
LTDNIISKRYEELTIADDFMFYKVMSDKELCKELLETILDIKIKKLVYHETQAVLKYTFNSICNEDKDIALDDGLTKVFVNASYNGNDAKSNVFEEDNIIAK